LREKYKSHIRQLPAKPFIEDLVNTYFQEVNLQYYPLDEGIFRDLLQSWNSLSFSTLNKGPLELSGDLQFFPALLFQILALALQFQPPDYDPNLESLKYAAAMSLDDLASDYSESGSSILALLGKRNTTLVAVQAGFLRTQFMKNCGLVPESWHNLSQTIRDAQEIGLHKEIFEYRRKPDSTPEEILENMWFEQLRRRVWMLLSLWDIHMAVVLGRPTTIDSRDAKPAFPIDAPVPKNRRAVAPALRTDSDPPTPLTMLLWNSEVAAPLWDIFNLEKEDPRQNNIAKVEKMHGLLDQISMHTPPFFRFENPDTSFDHLPECGWLPAARQYFRNATNFTVMALHRPYIFTNPNSRTAALKAGLEILRAQRAYFNLIKVNHYKMFALVLNTFDAIILCSAIYILHPCENNEDLDDVLQHFNFCMERFETMSGRNSMANGALGVLKAIHVRLKRALSQAKCPINPLPTPAPSSTSASNNESPPEQDMKQEVSTSIYPPPPDPALDQNSPPSSGYTLPTISNLTTTNPPVSAPTPGTANAWDAFSAPLPNPHLQQNYDFSSIAPLQPIHDLLFNDLGTVDGGLDLNTSGLDAGWSGGLNGVGNGPWQFEGDFGDDSFWGFMNSYRP
jgi:Fungal specific transcription factor domain